MAPPHSPVYLDTCVILVAHRTGCWRALVGRFELHTTHVCRQELTRGNPRDPKYIKVDMKAFDQDVRVHRTTSAIVTSAVVRSPTLSGVDDGEKDLLAWCVAQPDALLLTTGDRAAVQAACRLGLQDRLISLEELAQQAGAHPHLPRQFTRNWLSEVRTTYLVEEGGL